MRLKHIFLGMFEIRSVNVIKQSQWYDWYVGKRGKISLKSLCVIK